MSETRSPNDAAIGVPEGVQPTDAAPGPGSNVGGGFASAMTAARLAGHTWDDIRGYINDASRAAAEMGYGQDEVDAHLGYVDPTAFRAGLAAVAQQNEAQPLPEPALKTGLPDLSKPYEMPEDVPQSYADALNAGQVKGPKDFADAYAGATGSTPEAGEALAAQLPHPEDLIDHAIALTHANGDRLDLDTLGDARRNLLGLWASTAITPQEALADKNPILWDELTKPRDPDMPTFEDFNDQIGSKFNLGDNVSTLGAVANALVEHFLGGAPGWKEQEAYYKKMNDLIKANQEAGKPLLSGAADLGFSPMAATIALGMGSEGTGGMRTLLEHAGENTAKIGNDISVTIGGKTGKGATIEEAHADATKAEPEPAKLVVAAREPESGKVFVGKPEQIHADLVPDTGQAEMGFADAQGNFLTRKEALDTLPAREQSTLSVKDELDAADYIQNDRRIAPEEPPTVKINGNEYAAKEGETLSDFLERAQQENGQKVIGEAVAALGKARVDKVIDAIQPAQMMPEVAPLVRRVDDELNRLGTNAQVDKEKLWQAVKQLPKEWLNTAFQEKVSASVEQRLVDPAHAHEEEVQAFLNRVKKITDRQTELAEQIKAKTAGLDIDEVSSIRSVDEGYVRRVVQGKEGSTISPLDPEFQKDAITGGQPRNLTKRADSVNEARQYTMWHADGPEGEPPSRVWNNDREAKIGDTMVNPIDGQTNYTLKPATMAEVEANTATRYRKNFIANTADNVAKLERVNRNLDFLNSTAKELETAGLLQRDKPGSVQDIPSGFKRVDLPQLRGYANAKVADVLNDFWGGNKSDLQKWTEQASRFIMNSLFISPAVHIGNVGAHWFVGRGLDWANPMGYYRLVKYGAEAIHQVATKGEKYLQLLEHGSGLQFLSTQGEINNFYSTMMSKLFHEQMSDVNTWGSYARSLGFKAASDMVKTELKWSRQALWFMNDVFLMQRTLELMDRGSALGGRAWAGGAAKAGAGMSMQEAIYRAEKDIPNYRVPSAVMGSHVLSQVMQSPVAMNFGRYRYGQIRAIAATVRDLIPGSGASAADRLDAVAKLSIMYGTQAYLQPMIDTYIQQATGDKNWHMKGFGPFSLINAVKGLYNGEKEWGAAASSFFTWGKLLDIVDMAMTNKDFFGNKIIDDKKTWLGKLTGLGKAAASLFYPTQLLMQMTKPGGVAKSLGGLIGLDYGQPYVEPEWKRRMEQSIANKQEANDPIEGWLREHLAELGINAPAPPLTGGSFGGHGGGGGGHTAGTNGRQDTGSHASAGTSHGIVLRGGPTAQDRARRAAQATGGIVAYGAPDNTAADTTAGTSQGIVLRGQSAPAARSRAARSRSRRR